MKAVSSDTVRVSYINYYHHCPTPKKSNLYARLTAQDDDVEHFHADRSSAANPATSGGLASDCCGRAVLGRSADTSSVAEYSSDRPPARSLCCRRPSDRLWIADKDDVVHRCLASLSSPRKQRADGNATIVVLRKYRL